MMVKYFPAVIALGAVFLVMELRMHASLRKWCFAALKRKAKLLLKALPVCLKGLMVYLKHLVIWWAGIGGFRWALSWILPFTFDNGGVISSFLLAFMCAIPTWGIEFHSEIEKFKSRICYKEDKVMQEKYTSLVQRIEACPKDIDTGAYIVDLELYRDIEEWQHGPWAEAIIFRTVYGFSPKDEHG